MMHSTRSGDELAELRGWRTAIHASIRIALGALLGLGAIPAQAATAGNPDPDFGVFPGNGSQTIAFDAGGGFEDVARAPAIQPDGKVVATGWADRGTFDEDFAIARFDRFGALDPTFGGFPAPGKKLDHFDLGQQDRDRATAVGAQPDGKIVVGGYVETAGAGDSALAVARLLPDGQLDSSFGTGALDRRFGPGGKVLVPFDLGQDDDDTPWGLAIRPDRRVVVAGSVQRPLTGDLEFGIAQLLGDQVFADGFERGDSAVWSGAAP